jgi:hypothetical protein
MKDILSPSYSGGISLSAAGEQMPDGCWLRVIRNTTSLPTITTEGHGLEMNINVGVKHVATHKKIKTKQSSQDYEL